MKTRLIFIALLMMSIISTQYAYADGSDNHRRCVNPLNPFNDAIVGVWNGDLAIGGEGAPGIPISIAFHFGGTGTGMDINDVGGGEGFGGTVQNYAWKKTKKRNGYRILLSNIIKEPGLEEFGGGYRLGIDVTGKLSDDCQVLSLSGTLRVYALNDPTLDNPFEAEEGVPFVLPTSFELQRVDLLRD
ncbi:MAG: hypothetical protein OER22_11630 [Gammaproteobacteria bacterium]|nr:hypothetical protein [Gammaproteobacteria bacterium]MDH3374086.1 hypothetical protein [Gammaproteobacteria bacterium]MDH3408883.1 hypothetical protein [Gammaproteobacteria bacterium]MDH3553256.1 hypothetical protein [Gammaproteobacteria bacterium]